MRALATYIFFLSTLISFGQVEATSSYTLDTLIYFYTINSDTFQGKFKNNKAQTGKVTQFRKAVYKRTYKELLINGRQKDGVEYSVHAELLFSGQVDKGKKVSVWDYYSDRGTEYSSCFGSPTVEYTVQYTADKIIYDNYYGNRTITYNNDSTKVFGHIIADPKYLVQFNCDNGKCKFWYNKPKNVFDTCSYRVLSDKLTSIEMGLSNKRIKPFVKK